MLKRVPNFLNRQISRASALSLSLAVSASEAMAQGKAGKLEVKVLSDFGCSLLDFFTGSLAIWAFVLVAAGTLLIGLVARIDFAKLIQVVVIFGVLQGLGAWLAPMITNADSCIANNGQ